jgi:hypothetical protein
VIIATIMNANLMAVVCNVKKCAAEELRTIAVSDRFRAIRFLRLPRESFRMKQLNAPEVVDEVRERTARRNAPTHPSVTVRDTRDFEQERQRLLRAVERFANAPAERMRHPHFSFGAMTPEEWAAFSYIHIDYHLRQFRA